MGGGNGRIETDFLVMQNIFLLISTGDDMEQFFYLAQIIFLIFISIIGGYFLIKLLIKLLGFVFTVLTHLVLIVIKVLVFLLWLFIILIGGGFIVEGVGHLLTNQKVEIGWVALGFVLLFFGIGRMVELLGKKYSDTPVFQASGHSAFQSIGSNNSSLSLADANAMRRADYDRQDARQAQEDRQERQQETARAERNVQYEAAQQQAAAQAAEQAREADRHQRWYNEQPTRSTLGSYHDAMSDPPDDYW